ncbi:hypothetical protein ALI22I_20305 [Saccharothrix sp. ALI-22-I]|uniref:hypothetical protein n=1 Tax=Saccharothrix sp. ALI-22-I TaxID=1933778 RepID=UPI00097BD9AC|nr:hypothetical protein [Saccharothrix sp. ALI-22-I]ONI88083.1 hypothetical protein ALI22I_20305 [Saccharothrix sp. ALI-22-I]
MTNTATEATSSPSELVVTATILRRDPDWVPDVTAVGFSGWAGEGDMLSVSLSGSLLTDHDAEAAAAPWTACIWPGHEDGEKHYCHDSLDRFTPVEERGWCLRRYTTPELAVEALDTEYERRRAVNVRRELDSRWRDATSRGLAGDGNAPEVALHYAELYLRAAAKRITGDWRRRAGILRVADRVASQACIRPWLSTAPTTGRAVRDSVAQELMDEAQSLPDGVVADWMCRAARSITPLGELLPEG